MPGGAGSRSSGAVRSADRTRPRKDISPMRSLRTLCRGAFAAAALLSAAAPAALALAGPAAAAEAAPAPGTCPAVAVTTAELVRTVDGPAILVTGVKPHADTSLRLEAEQVDFVQQPDYWTYTVVGCGGTGPVVKTPFTTTFRVPTSPVGRFGITVNGIAINLGDGPVDGA